MLFLCLCVDMCDFFFYFIIYVFIAKMHAVPGIESLETRLKTVLCDSSPSPGEEGLSYHAHIMMITFQESHL